MAFAIKNGKVELSVLHLAPEAIVSGYGMLDAQGRRLPAEFDAASLLALPQRGKR